MPQTFRMLMGLLVVLSAACWMPSARAQSERPESSRRLVRVWDFEDTPQDPRPVPRNWFRAQDNPPERVRPGFPKEWNLAVVDNTVAHSGQWSVKLPTQGGSTSLTLSRGVIPALPDGDYHVSAAIRTEALVHARARIVARLLDERMGVIDGSETACEPVVTEGVWRPVGLLLRGDARAAWLQLELQLLQPEQLSAAPRGPFDVRLQDVRGAAWFDDIGVFQIPRVELYTPGTAGVTVAPQRPEVIARVQDLTGEALRAHVQVFDIGGAVIAERHDEVDPSGRPLVWSPELPRYGWYRAALRVHGPEGVVGQVYSDFVWSAPKRVIDRERASRFALVAPALDDDALRGLPPVVSTALSGGLYLPLWTERVPADDAIDSAVERLIELNQDIGFVLERVPASLARDTTLDSSSVLALLAGERDDWVAQLGPLLSKFGERVRRYQIGPMGEASAYWRGDLGVAVPRAEERLRRVIPRPIVTLPWSIEQPMAQSAGSALSVLVPASLPAEALPMYGPHLTVGGEATLVLETLDPQRFGWRAAAAELARKAVCAWSVSGARVAISMPWQWRAEDRRGPIPTPLLGVWRTLLEQLAEREMVGTLPVADGVTALIAQGPRGSAIIAWNTRYDPEQMFLRGYLGSGQVTACDLFGNQWTVTASEGEHRVPLGATPVFIEGIDANLARFRAGMRVEPGFIPARATKHEIEIVITNPWDFTVTGRVRIADPEEWEITPRVAVFTIAGGATERIPLTVAFALNEEAGTRMLAAEVSLTADRLYPTMRVPLSVEVGLESVTMQPSVRVINDASGAAADVELTMLVTNSSDRPQTLEAFALAPGHRGQQAPISALEPGQSTVRRFVFAGGAASLRGKTIRVGLKEQNGSGRLNKTVLVP